jgi:hypothetical protein
MTRRVVKGVKYKKNCPKRSSNENYKKKKTQVVLKKNVSAHNRAHDLHALMSGAIFEHAHERYLNRSR